jgi:dihydrofolate reductase
MRKVVVFMLITADGYFEGTNREIDWHNVDAEFNEFAIEQLDSSGILLFGRVTYELMASYWPTEAAITDDPLVAKRMNNLPKIVFSETLEKAEWNNTRLVKENAEQEVMKLKQEPGKDIKILGSSSLSAFLIDHGLIDEFRILVNPIILGKGHSLFEGINDKLNLKLVKSRTFKSGNVLLIYEKAK